MPPPPDFADPSLFPSFADLPEAPTEDATSTPASDSTTTGTDPNPNASPHFLLAQVKDDMTITKPTLILSDIASAPFALVFDGPGVSRDSVDLKALGLRKGATAVVRGARRVAPAEEGKRGFVRVDVEPFLSSSSSSSSSRDSGEQLQVKALPAPLEQVLEIGARRRLRWLDAQEQGGAGGGAGAVCDACGKVKGQDGNGKLLRCTGCGEAWYCDKACQMKGWNEGGHKAECKVLKGMVEIWGSEDA